MNEEHEKDNDAAQSNFPIENKYVRKNGYSAKSKEERIKIAEEFLASGMSGMDFAKQIKIGYSTLKQYEVQYYKANNIIPKHARKPGKYITKKAKVSVDKNLFKELKVSNEINIPTSNKPDHIEIVANNNIKLRMPGNTDINYLIQIIKGLSE